MNKVFVGIDNGLSGAIGVIAPNYRKVYDMPILKIEGKRTRSRATGKVKVKIKRTYDIKQIYNIIGQIRCSANEIGATVEIWLEKAQVMPKQGGVSNFSIGFGYGVMHGVITCHQISLNLVHPVTWKKKIMFGQGKEKDAAVYKAQQLFPELEFHGPQGGMKDGRAEAMLITEYGRVYSPSNF